MPSMMAIVSKAVFEKEARGLAEGDVWAIECYASQNKALAPLADGGDLYLVTVRPPETLWLVAVLVKPASKGGQWRAKPNRVAIRVIDDLKGTLKFTTGTGIAAKPGALGMSLQTPRTLAADDVALLGGTAKPAKSGAAKVVAARVSVAKAPAAKPAKLSVKPAAGGELPALASTLAALQADQPGTALGHALAAWRTLRAPELADLVIAIGAHVDRSMTPITGKKPDVQITWLDFAALRRPVDLGRLLASLDDAPLPKIRQRFELLGAFAPDPRLAPRMLGIPANYSYEAGPCFTMAFDIAERSGDPRLRSILDDMLKRVLVTKQASKAWKEYFARHARRATATRDALPVSVVVSAPIRAQVTTCIAACKRLGEPATEAAILAQASPATSADGTLDDLLGAVLRDPDDDQARAVYADALEERGDPRGEFIALQLRRAHDGKLPAAAEARERALIKQHGRDWIAPLDAAVSAESIRFSRGFLDAATVAWKTDAQRDKLYRHPLWATVREFDTDDQEFLAQPELLSMRCATVVPRTLAKLAERKRPVPLEAVVGSLEMRYGIRMQRGMPVGRAKQWGKALDIGALANLSSLQLAEWSDDKNDRDDDLSLTPKGIPWLLDSKLGRQIRELELHAGRGEIAIAPWIDLLATKRGDLAVRIRFTNGNTASGSTNILVTFDLARRGDQVDVILTLNNDMADIRYLTIGRQIDDTLEGLPSKRAPTLVVRYGGSKKRTKLGFPSIADRLRQAFAKVTLE